MSDNDISFRIGREEIVLRRRYEILSIANDILIGIWFIVGSILFFSVDTSYTGTWLFLIGSIQMLWRPVIRLARHIHVQRVTPTPRETIFDF